MSTDPQVAAPDSTNLFAPSETLDATQLCEAIEFGTNCIAALGNALGVIAGADGVRDDTPGMLGLMTAQIADKLQAHGARLQVLVHP